MIKHTSPHQQTDMLRREITDFETSEAQKNQVTSHQIAYQITSQHSALRPAFKSAFNINLEGRTTNLGAQSKLTLVYFEKQNFSAELHFKKFAPSSTFHRLRLNRNPFIVRSSVGFWGVAKQMVEFAQCFQ